MRFPMRYTVTVTIEGDYGDEYEAACGAYRILSELLASPPRGDIGAVVTNTETGDAVAMSLFDGVLEVDPLFASQVIGFRHLIWINQNPPRKTT